MRTLPDYCWVPDPDPDVPPPLPLSLPEVEGAPVPLLPGIIVPEEPELLSGAGVVLEPDVPPEPDIPPEPDMPEVPELLLGEVVPPPEVEEPEPMPEPVVPHAASISAQTTGIVHFNITFSLNLKMNR